MRVFFATDIHGSEICWRKFLNAAAFYKALSWSPTLEVEETLFTLIARYVDHAS